MTSDVYTNQQWAKDREFKAVPGQQISEEIYDHMLNCIQPITLPRIAAEYALRSLDIPVHAGFLMGSEYDTDPKTGKPRYMGFGMNDYGRGRKYFYLGLFSKESVLNGIYYHFDCLATISDHLYKADTFDEDEAKRFAADYEATLSRIEFRNGERVKSEVLYEPFLA